MNPRDRLLVIDDNHSIVLAVTAALREALHQPIDVAYTLAEAKHCLTQPEVNYLAAVVDLHLPDAEDHEAVDLVLAHNIPCIVLTSNLDEKLRDDICARPLVDYVVKHGVNALEVVRAGIGRLLRNPARKTLVIDSESFCAYLKVMLEVQKLQVFTATCAAEAMQVLNAHPDISLALVNEQLPDKQGCEVVNLLRSRFPSTDMVIIGTTDSQNPFDSGKLLKAGANDVLRKPFIVEELISRINACLDNLDNIRTIADQANHDYLTQIYNRRYLFIAGNTLYSNAAREHIKLTVAILDIDYFKRINDTYGHDAGDAALIAVANTLKNSLRSGDIVARFGGEEFCILAINVDQPQQLIEHIRTRVEALAIKGWGQPIQLTVSAGHTSTLGHAFEDMLHRADTALYKAKNSGRNCSMED
jgi:diguanylate cyclase (GGDEF)-like protein